MNQCKPLMASQLLLLFPHCYPITTKLKFRLEGGVLLPPHSIPSPHFSDFALKVPSPFSYLFCHYSYSVEKDFEAQRGQIAQMFFGSQAHSMKHHNIGASIAYVDEDFLVPFIRQEDQSGLERQSLLPKVTQQVWLTPERLLLLSASTCLTSPPRIWQAH